MDCTFLTLTEEGFVGSNAWLDLHFCRGFNAWSLYMLMSTNSRLPAFKILLEVLLAEGRDKVQRHRLLIFYFVARHIVKWPANMCA